MNIDLMTAELIAQMAENLGLPSDKEEELVAALTGVNVGISGLSEAESIWKDSGLPPETFSRLTDEDCIAWVNSDILPKVKSYVMGKISQKAAPESYPFSTTVLESAYPNFTSSQIEIMVADWEVQRWNAVKFLALCEIFLLADTLKGDYREKSEALCALGEKYLETLTMSITKTVELIPGGSGGGIGVLVIKLRKNKRSGNEYSY
jgi:hypothetical protein